jgi:glycosyltransferase A (GT-A) superfamily protein (DUF2064 family)
MSPNCLIIFTRYPKPGKTKTRLIPALGADGAALLQAKVLSLFNWARKSTGYCDLG